jgi:hypothetical protein
MSLIQGCLIGCASAAGAENVKKTAIVLHPNDERGLFFS